MYMLYIAFVFWLIRIAPIPPSISPSSLPLTDPYQSPEHLHRMEVCRKYLLTMPSEEKHSREIAHICSVLVAVDKQHRGVLEDYSKAQLLVTTSEKLRNDSYELFNRMHDTIDRERPDIFVYFKPPPPVDYLEVVSIIADFITNISAVLFIFLVILRCLQ